MSEFLRINPQTITTPFQEYPEELKITAKDCHVNLPDIHTMRGQALALLAQPENRGGRRWVDRETSREFFRRIGMESLDSIQPFNKCRLKRMKCNKNGFYSVKYPYEFDPMHRQRPKMNPVGTSDDMINEIKQWYRENIVDVPNSDWHIGHLDPTTMSDDSDNLAPQPPIQARYKDHYKFDEYFNRKWPTADYLTRGKNMEKFYTTSEEMTILRYLINKYPNRVRNFLTEDMTTIEAT